MIRTRSRTALRIITGFLATSLLIISIYAQQDPDPNSPTPVLIPDSSSSNRVLAVAALRFGRTNPKRAVPDAFAPNSKLMIFISNVDLMEGEGANAFRVYAVDADGREYRFPVLDIQPASERLAPGTYALTIRLHDEIGFFDPPPIGDLLVRVSWRGLTSDRLRLGYGKTGGNVKDDAQPYSSLYKGQATATNNFFEPPTNDYVGYRWSGDRSRFFEQATFGPTSLLDSRIRRIGLRTYLAEQFAAPYPSFNNPYPNQPLRPGTAPSDCDGDNSGLNGNPIDVPLTCNRDTYSMYPIQAWFMRESFYGDNQLRHRVAWALSQIWVTSGVDIQQSRHMVEYHKILSRNAFGNYRTLMREMSLSPTMGDYLDMARSTRNNPNENYARELMQLFTVGLFMLNQDGTQQTSGGNPIPTYDQNVVNNLTRVLTGWSFCQTAGANCPNIVLGSVNFIDPMLLNTNNHDVTAKTLLSYPGSTTTNIAACANCTNATNTAAYANASLDQALDNIFNHPTLGPYISKILIQQMVTSDPTPAYVARVADAFNNNGFGVRGDMTAVIRAVLLDPEARGDVKTDPNYGKLREPVQLATNLLRIFNVRSANGNAQSDGAFNRSSEFNGMSQSPFRSPTVFNYYQPGYIIPNTSLLGPEFGLMTTSTSIQRANFVNRMVFSTISINLPDIPDGTSIDLSELQSIAATDTSGNFLLDTLNQRMMHGTMSPTMRASILTAVTNIVSSNALARAQQALYLVATSSQYQVQR